MKKIGLSLFGLLLTTFLQAQSFETVVKAWLDDAPNGFHNVLAQYGRNCGGHCLDIDALHSSYSGSSYKAYLELKPQGSLVDTYTSLKAQMEQWPLLRGWERSSSVYTDHNIMFKTKKPNGEQWVVSLTVGQNYDASKPRILSLFISRNGLSSPRVAVPDIETFPLTGAVSNAAVVNLKSRLANEQGKAALKELIASAESDFEGILLKNTFRNNVYQVREGHLNPKATKPFVTVTDEPQKRTLTLRFQIDDPKNYFVFGDLLYPPYNYNTLFPKTEWDLDESDMWKADHKTKPYLIVQKGYEQGVDVLEIIAVKKAYRANLAANPDLVNNDCLEGDCVNGFGIMKYSDNNQLFRYEGGFRNGKFHGIGFVYRESGDGLTLIDLERNRQGTELLLYVGQHQDGKRIGKGLFYAYAHFKDPVRSFRDKSEYFQAGDQTGVFNYIFQEYRADTLFKERLCSFTYHKKSANTYHSIEQPFTTEFGQCVSGDCQNGSGVLDIKGLGRYEGQFIRGAANGRGILKMATGEWKEFEVHQGIPEYIRTVKLPGGVSRLPAAARNVWLLADNDCIAGNCYNGEGLQLRVNTDRFRRYNVRYRGLVRSRFQNGVAEGPFKILSYDGQKVIADGTFKQGVFDGTLRAYVSNRSTPELEYYQTGRRVTKDGRDYAEYLAEQRELWQEEYERKRQEAIAEGIAEGKRRMAEAEARRIRASKASTSRPRSYHCSSCKGTGLYWNEIVTQDCTTTYDYTYTSGKYYKTYTNCRDVTNGGYITCPVCGGDGRY
jgi:hypothetical protein